MTACDDGHSHMYLRHSNSSTTRMSFRNTCLLHTLAKWSNSFENFSHSTEAIFDDDFALHGHSLIASEHAAFCVQSNLCLVSIGNEESISADFSNPWLSNHY